MKVIKLQERRSPQIKELHYVGQEDGFDVYSVYTKWPDCPELDGYCRMGYSNYEGRIISFIDFDGGPMISVGSRIENYTVSKIVSDTSGIKLYLIKDV